MKRSVGFIMVALIVLAGMFSAVQVSGYGGGLQIPLLHEVIGNGCPQQAGITACGSFMNGGIVRALGQERYWPWHMMDYGPGMMGYWFGGFLVWIILIVIGAAAVYIIIHMLKQKDTDTLMSETPLDILKKRYARGEISKEEFDEIRKNIEE